MTTVAVARPTVAARPVEPVWPWRAAARAAALDLAPGLAALVPLALVIGVTVASSGGSPALGLVSTLAIYAGTAQLSALRLLDDRAALAVVLLSVVVINARLTLYAAALEPHFSQQPRWFRWIGPHFVVDQTFALATARDDLRDPVRFRRYWLSLGGLLGAAFVSLIATGVVLGPRLAWAGSALAFAPAALFLGLLVPRLTDRPGLVAAGAGACVTAVLLLIGGAPAGTPVLVGALSGITAAAVVQRRDR